jgi:hypothetical protein
MSEEQVEYIREEAAEYKKENQQDPIKKLASAYGWNSNGEKSADEYIKFALEKLPERTEALTKQAKKIEDKDSELSQMKTVLNELSGHMKKQKELEQQKISEALRLQRVEAIKKGDVAKVEEIDKQANQNQQQPRIVLEFKERHADWLNGTSFEALEMREWAENRDKKLAKLGLNVDEHMSTLEQHVKKKFPEYFKEEGEEVETEIINKSNAVDSSHSSNVVHSNKTKKSYSLKDLSDQQKKVADYLVKNKQMKLEEYIKELIETGDLQ